jgi:hypothetical protein
MNMRPADITRIRAAGISGVGINRVLNLVGRGFTLEQAIRCVQREN